jgi:hypothetical protein
MFLLCDTLHSIQSNWVLILSAEIEVKNEVTVLQDDKEKTKHLLKKKSPRYTSRSQNTTDLLRNYLK